MPIFEDRTGQTILAIFPTESDPGPRGFGFFKSGIFEFDIGFPASASQRRAKIAAQQQQRQRRKSTTKPVPELFLRDLKVK